MRARFRIIAIAVIGLMGSTAIAAESASAPQTDSAIVQAGWGDPVVPAAGCDTCAPARHHGGLLSGLTIGEGCRNSAGCGNLATARTFMFGGCNQFFNPGYKCRLCGRSRGSAPVGAGGLGDHCPCVYGTYLNR